MPVSAQTLRVLLEAGLAGETLVRVVEAIDADMMTDMTSSKMDAAAEKRRAWDRDRKAKAAEAKRSSTGNSTINSTGIPPEAVPSLLPQRDNQTLTSQPPKSSLRSDSSTPSGVDLDLFENQRKPKRAKPVDEDVIQEVCQIWNDAAASMGLAQIRDIPNTRVSHIRARLKDLREVYGHDDPIAGFEALIIKIRGSPMLRGQNDRGWKASFDWVTKAENFTKIMEGNYAGAKPKTYTNGHYANRH